VVHEDTLTAGFGGEILAALADSCFANLDAPMRRMTMPDLPVPYSLDLMHAVLPDSERIAGAIGDLLAF
jgi:2-oxoisovalerate dehydrogenase E1 component